MRQALSRWLGGFDLDLQPLAFVELVSTPFHPSKPRIHGRLLVEQGLVDLPWLAKIGTEVLPAVSCGALTEEWFRMFPFGPNQLSQLDKRQLLLSRVWAQLLLLFELRMDCVRHFTPAQLQPLKNGPPT